MANGIDRADSVQAGQVLFVSRGPEHVGYGGDLYYRTYAAMPGDSIWSIARRAGVSVQSLMELNRWTEPVQLGVGQTIIIRK